MPVQFLPQLGGSILYVFADAVLRERALALRLEQSRRCAQFDIGLSQFNLASCVLPVCRERQLEHRIASFTVFRLFIEWRDRATQRAHQLRLEGWR